MAASRNIFSFMVRTAWQNAGPMRPLMVLFYGMLLTANIIISFQPIALAKIINTAQTNGPDALHDALLWAGVYAGLTLGFWMLHGPARIVERRVAFTVYKNFVTGLYRKVTEMPLRWHQDHHSGGLINRVNKAGRSLFTFAESQFVILQTVMRFSASLILLAWYSWWVALASIVSSTLIILLVRKFDKKLVPLVRTTNERDHHLNAALYDYIGNIITVLTLRLQGNTAHEIDHRFNAMKTSYWKQIDINEVKWFCLNFLLVAVLAAITGAYVVVSLEGGKSLAVGAIVAVFQYLFTINMQFYQGTLSYETLLYQHTDVHGIDGLIEDHARLTSQTAGAKPAAWKNIEIRHLDFTHTEGEDVLHHLKDVALSISPHKKIALIGSSGSGKTTLLTLLRGLYEAHKVDLVIDGVNYQSLAPLSGFTTLVPQDTEIFENTVRYNLTLGTDVPDAIVEQALSISTFDEVVPKLPNGLATDIRERGVNLSGGQKQRLSLARGLIAARDSSLLLLDEPTSSVDIRTESAIFDRLFALFGDKTIIASIHRLHLLPRFDHIALMVDGVITEQGSFTDLMAKNGAFAGVWKHHLAQSEAA